MSLFKDGELQSVASGAANVEASLHSLPMAGGAVSQGDGMRVRTVLSAYGGTAAFRVLLGALELCAFGGVQNGERLDLTVTIYRTGPVSAEWVVDARKFTPGSDDLTWQVNGASGGAVVSWSSPLSLSVKGTCDHVGGAIAQRTTVER